MPRRTAGALTGLTRFALATLAPPRDGIADERDELKVGLQPDGRAVPTNQILRPAGR